MGAHRISRMAGELGQLALLQGTRLKNHTVGLVRGQCHKVAVDVGSACRHRCLWRLDVIGTATVAATR